MKFIFTGLLLLTQAARAGENGSIPAPLPALESYFSQQLKAVNGALASEGPATVTTLNSVNLDFLPEVSFGVSGFLSFTVSPEIDFVVSPNSIAAQATN